MMDLAAGNPPPLHSHLLHLQWVSAVLKRLEAAWRKDRRSLSINHPMVTSLVEGLSSPTPGHVTSTCTVLLAACVQHGWIAHQELLAAMVTQAVTAPVYSPILESLGRLMLQEMAAIVESCSLYISPYSLRVNVHPFVSILNSRPAVGASILSHTLRILESQDLSQPSVQLMEPLIKHLLLHPSPPPEFSSLASSLHSDLTHLASTCGGANHLVELLARLLPLQPINKESQLLTVVTRICHLTPLQTALCSHSRGGLIDLCLHVCLELTRSNLALFPLVNALTTLLQSNPECVQGYHVLGLGWLLLHHLPSPHTSARLLTLCAELTLSVPLPRHLSSILVLPLMQLLSQPISSLHLLDNAPLHSSNLRTAKSLFKHIQDSSGKGRSAPGRGRSHTTHTSGALSSMVLSVRQFLWVQEDPTLIEGWLEAAVKGVESEEKGSQCEFLSLLVVAVAMSFRDNPDVLEPVLHAVGRLAKALPAMASSLLPFLLYLNKSVPDSHSKLLLLHSIPSLATHTLPAMSVLSVFKVLGSELALLPLATHLLGKAWHLQDQLFPHVMEFLTRPLPPSLPTVDVKAIEVARATVMRDVCSHRAEQHGEQMLSLLSRTLTSSYHDTLQVAMALESVVSLCLHEVVDVVTVWGVLGKGGRLTSDLRPGVLVALCSLFGLAVDLDPEANHSHKVFQTTALHFLWQHVFSQTVAVSSAALKALAGFNIESFSTDHLPRELSAVLLQQESHDKSHDSESLPLVASHCVQIVHYICHGALDAYSAFLASVLEAELEGLSRGVVYSAMKRAAVTSPQEAGLQSRAKTLRERRFSSRELCNGYVKSCALLGLMEPPHQLPEGQVTRQRELRTALDGKLVKLKDLLNSCEGLLPDLVGGTLWEGLPIVCTCRQWEAMRGICQLFYQIRLTAVNSDLSSPLPRQQQQAHDWAMKQTLKVLQDYLSNNPSTAPSVFMAVVGVASFPHMTAGGKGAVPLAVESLLLDLLNLSLGELSAGSHLTSAGGHVTYTHALLEAIATSGASHLTEAVILGLPSLLRSVTGHWGPLFPGEVQDRIAAVGGGLLQCFNDSPNWYTSLVLSQVFEQSLRGFATPLEQLLPFLEAATQGTSAELLSLAAALVPALLARGKHTLATALFSALEQLLAHVQPTELSSHIVQLCCLHFSSALGQSYAVGLLSSDVAMAGVTQLADLATQAPTESVLQLSLGLLLHYLSACGHGDAHSLAESVGAKWLQECASRDTDQVVAVMMGLAGLLGVEPLRGVAWESRCSVSQHMDMMVTLAYLVTDRMDKLGQCEVEKVRCVALWLATQTAVDVTQTMTWRERVPPDYHYLPTTSALPVLLDTCKAVTAQPLTERTQPVFLTLLRGLSQHSGLLPPVDYSSLFRPILFASGCGPELQRVCLCCLTRTKEGQGFKHLLLYCSLPCVFLHLQESCQVLLLESLPLLAPVLHCSQRLDAFLCEVSMLLSKPLPLYQPLSPILSAFVKGLRSMLTTEGLDPYLQRSMVAGLEMLYGILCQGVQDVILSHTLSSPTPSAAPTSPTPCTTLHHSPIWEEVAGCVSIVQLQLPKVDASAAVSGEVYVGVLVSCSLVKSGGRPFKYLAPAVDWVLTNFPAMDEGARTSSLFFSLFSALLRTVHSCCTQKGKLLLLHQTELFHMLSVWTRENQMIRVGQWRAVLLLALTGSTLTSIDPILTLLDSTNTGHLELIVTGVQMTSVPTAPVVREKLITSLLDWLGYADSDLIKDTILGYFSALKSCDEYRKSVIWSTVAHLL